LAAGLRYALSQDTRVLVLCSGDCVFSNGIHLGVIEAAADPAAEAWANRADQRAPAGRRPPARSIGLIDAVGPRGLEAFAGWLHEVAAEQGKGWQWRSTLDCKAERPRRAAKPLSYYETRELAEMAGDMFDDRKGFAAARRAFMYKEKPTGTPAKLALHRQVEMAGVA
jgi:hypothetical protein